VSVAVAYASRVFRTRGASSAREARSLVPFASVCFYIKKEEEKKDSEEKNSDREKNRKRKKREKKFTTMGVFRKGCSSILLRGV
jgi:hypothetical protein